MDDPHYAAENLQPVFTPCQSEIGSGSPSINAGLALLLQACRFASEVSRDRWDFAVEINNLRRAGLNESHFRWFVCKGFVEHANEVTSSGQKGRCFHPAGELIFTSTSCMVLTPAGIAYAENSLARTPFSGDHPGGKSENSVWDRLQNGYGALPKWDPNRHELWLGNQLIKQFKHRSPNQEIILAAFQEEGWPVSVRDPLRPVREVDSKRRLNDTIKSLNHHQMKELIRFRGDGTGEGIIWEHVGRTGCENTHSN